MELVLPRSQFRAFSEFVRLSPEQRQALQEALTQISPTLKTRRLAELVSEKIRAAPAPLNLMLTMFTSMYEIRTEQKMSAEAFAQAICNFAAASASTELKPPDNDWEPVKKSLAAILSLDKTIGVIAKGFGVVSEFERIFESGRIVTDLRPIFGESVAERPAALAVVHELRIKYFTLEGSKEFFVSLDASHIKNLRQAMDRAMQKEETLKVIIPKDIPYLEAGET
jgi:hypothetical protein